MIDLVYNRVAQATFLPWVAAQVLKVVIVFIWKRKLELPLLTSAGGMPSSHAAMVCGLATAIAIQEGTKSPLFVMAVALVLVVTYDAVGIRRAASIQARILNQMIDELFSGHPLSETRLRELLGHTPIQVIVGAVLGIVGAWFLMSRP